jgi:hypothetical protein
MSYLISTHSSGSGSIYAVKKANQGFFQQLRFISFILQTYLGDVAVTTAMVGRPEP